MIDDEANDSAETNALAQRLKSARRRKFKSAALAVAALKERWGIKRRTYYSHEAGERNPTDEDIRRYAELFDVTPAYLRYGDGAELIEAATVNEDESSASAISINHHRRQIDTTSSHNARVRFIVILSADQVRDLSAGRGDLAQMSGRMLPVPDFLEASRASFAYQIPDDDLSMVATSGDSFPPRTCFIIDPERIILPGELCFVDLDDYGPVVRKFVATRAYAPGMGFQLQAANSAYQPITVDAPGQLRLIGRIIWSGKQH